MIATVWKIGWLNLLRDRPALALTFALPPLFFSIFATVFGSIERGGAGSVRAAVVFADAAAPTAVEVALERLLTSDPRLEVERALSRSDAAAAVRDGRAAAAVVVPEGLAGALSRGGPSATRIEILADSRAEPIAPAVVTGALRGALFELWAESRFPAASGLSLPVDLAVVELWGRGGTGQSSVSFFAAGIGVMFLLFAVSGRGSLLIEERQSGVLSRMLTSGLGWTSVLAGRWLYLASVGFVQVSLMFVWGSIAFGLDLWSPYRLAGFVLMTSASAAAAAALGLLLSVVCRTRAQLGGVAVVVVLAMSALGGSLFPRFLMSDGLRRLGLATFNAWALDGYQKVFWYEAPLVELWPQLLVLAAATVSLLSASRLLAARSLRGAGL